MTNGATPKYTQPVDLLVATVSPERAAGFVNTCLEAAAFMQAAEPDLVFFPNRGAAPMLHAIQGANALDDIPCIEPLIGSAMSMNGGKGIDGGTKKAMLEEYILPGMHVGLMDESQHGGTIKQHRALATHITDNPVVTCQFQDDRISPRYCVGNGDTTRFFVGPLFHVDRNGFLDEIVIMDGERQLRRNTDAVRVFETLGGAITGPIAEVLLVGDQSPVLPPEQITAWVADFNAQGLSI
ncbi:MAG: hypothetical protein KIH63_002955 [Candidatus Saccharibacteria bacterium]|nr:hypothetical protein [Candidatus Saccharibacteria bacterium]